MDSLCIILSSQLTSLEVVQHSIGKQTNSIYSVCVCVCVCRVRVSKRYLRGMKWFINVL